MRRFKHGPAEPIKCPNRFTVSIRRIIRLLDDYPEIEGQITSHLIFIENLLESANKSTKKGK